MNLTGFANVSGSFDFEPFSGFYNFTKEIGFANISGSGRFYNFSFLDFLII